MVTVGVSVLVGRSVGVRVLGGRSGGSFVSLGVSLSVGYASLIEISGGILVL